MEDISLHILDIAENSVASGASLITISIDDKPAEDSFLITIEDNGRGMTREFAMNVLDPFSTTRTTRKVGLGLSFLAQSARETGGDVRIESVPDRGTVVSASFRPSHIDMKPLGNIADTIITLIAGNPGTHFVFSYRRDSRTYQLDTREICAALEGVPINAAQVLSAVRGDLMEGLDAMRG